MTVENKPLSLSSTNTLEKLSTNAAYFEAMVETVAKQTQAFVESYHRYSQPFLMNNDLQPLKHNFLRIIIII
ncbi:hypothetical protein [Winogradskyella wichelsiae]|uniref:hypothetical protein n=1 Tax=Winogradskyella wichelsiae TaxID=2697007 RepID=UPI0015C82025|nr:hypothetical protein [Winogradskyella wichelsiae]